MIKKKQKNTNISHKSATIYITNVLFLVYKYLNECFITVLNIENICMFDQGEICFERMKFWVKEASLKAFENGI